MKKIISILIISFLMPFISKGQVEDTIGINLLTYHDSTSVIKGGGNLSLIIQSVPESNLPKTDTIGVILLVNDTDDNPMSYIIKGYSVRNRHNPNEESNGGWFCYSCKDYMKHSYYLDAKKKRLSSNIIVWMSQPAK